MILNKLTKQWAKGKKLTGNFLLSTGNYHGQKVIFITWPQGSRNVLTYIRQCDLADDDPVNELFNLPEQPNWFNTPDIQLTWDNNNPKLYSDKYRLN